MIELTYVPEDDDDYNCSPVKAIKFQIIDEADIDSLLEEMDRFIRAVGYYPQGTLQYINEEEGDEKR